MCEPQNGVNDDDRCSNHSVFDIFDHGHHGPSWPVMVAWGLFALWHPQSGQARESFQSWGRRQAVKTLKIKVYHVRRLRVCFHWRLILDIVIYVYIYNICYCIYIYTYIYIYSDLYTWWHPANWSQDHLQMQPTFFSSAAGGLLDQADHELRKDGPLRNPGSQGHRQGMWKGHGRWLCHGEWGHVFSWKMIEHAGKWRNMMEDDVLKPSNYLWHPIGLMSHPKLWWPGLWMLAGVLEPGYTPCKSTAICRKRVRPTLHREGLWEDLWACCIFKYCILYISYNIL